MVQPQVWRCSIRCRGCRCYRADEAGVVPGVAQRLDELVAGLHGEVTAVTFGAEEGDVIWWADRKLGVDL